MATYRKRGNRHQAVVRVYGIQKYRSFKTNGAAKDYVHNDYIRKFEAILCGTLRSSRVPLISIHDTFIIVEDHSSELKAVMADCYYKRFRKEIAIK